MKSLWLMGCGLVALAGCAAGAVDEERTGEAAQDVVAQGVVVVPPVAPQPCGMCRTPGDPCVSLDRLTRTEDGAVLHRWVPSSETSAVQADGWTLEMQSDLALFAHQSVTSSRKPIYNCELVVVYPTFPDVPPPPPYIRDFLSDDPTCGGQAEATAQIGWLEVSPAPQMQPIYRLTNPATADQYLTNDPSVVAALTGTGGGDTLQPVLPQGAAATEGTATEGTATSATGGAGYVLQPNLGYHW